MIRRKSKLIIVIVTCWVVQTAFVDAMKKTFDAEATVESLVNGKSKGGSTVYGNYSLDELKLLTGLVWRMLDPGYLDLVTALGLKLNISSYTTWENLNKIRAELLAEIERRDLLSAMQAIPVPLLTQSDDAQPLQPSLAGPIYLIDTNAVPNLIIGKVQMNDRTAVIQLRSVDQSVPTMSDTFGGETCPILALHNAMNILGYAYTGDTAMLANINNEAVVKQFLMRLGSRRCQWNRLTTQEVEQLFSVGIPAYLSKNIQVVDSVIELGNPNTGEEIFDKTSGILKDIRAGLKEENFAYSLVMGDGEFIQLELKPGITMHYISFSIIKKSNQIQYIIADSLGNKSHLAGMRWAQLNYLIYLINNGFLESSLVSYTDYLRTIAREEKKQEEDEYDQQLRNIYGIQSKP